MTDPSARPDRAPLALILPGLVAASVLVLCFCLAGCGGAQSSSTPPAATASPRAAAATTQQSGTTFMDVDGDAIHAHGGGILKHGAKFYWVGENRGEDDRFRYVSLYESTDLVHWRFASHILSQASHPELATATVERPKLLYNEATDRFVLWMHWENGHDYSEARVAVATASRVDGPYDYRGSFRPMGFESRDMTVFADDDGAAYLVSAAAGNADLHVYRLDVQYTGVESLVARPWLGAFREAPAMFSSGGTYYLLTSGATGWDPNQAKYATAADPAGPWSSLRDVGDSTAFGSQAAFVLSLEGEGGTDILYLGDRWGGSMGGKVNDSGYVWLKLQRDAQGELALDWTDALRIDISRGTIEAATPSKPSE